MGSRATSEIQIFGKVAEGARKRLHALSRRAVDGVGLENVSLSIFVLPSRELRSIKKRFLPLTKHAVDVLAFPYDVHFPHPETRKRPVGELYLNRAVVVGPRGTLTSLLVHGILHLVGYDHQKKRDMLKMDTMANILIDRMKQYS